MINRIYRLTDKHTFEIFLKEIPFDENLVMVRPTYMSICRADQRYYNFERPAEVLAKKIPMALIHEAVGKVIFDPLRKFDVGQKVILIPTIPTETDIVVEENYLRSSLFCSSSCDGFMQEMVNHPRARLVPVSSDFDSEVIAYSELMSVAIHAIKRFDRKSHIKRNCFGIWGDGSLGFIVSLFVKAKYPNAKIIVFGKSNTKLQFFSFADEVRRIEDKNSIPNIDHAFECVGGYGCQNAINQIIDLVNPEGVISLLGVSEEAVSINTRMCLEKGLTLLGNSRSSKNDFEEVLNLLKERPNLMGYLKNLITQKISVKNLHDIKTAFELDRIKPWGKTLIEWSI